MCTRDAFCICIPTSHSVRIHVHLGSISHLHFVRTQAHCMCFLAHSVHLAVLLACLALSPPTHAVVGLDLPSATRVARAVGLPPLGELLQLLLEVDALEEVRDRQHVRADAVVPEALARTHQLEWVQAARQDGLLVVLGVAGAPVLGGLGDLVQALARLHTPHPNQGVRRRSIYLHPRCTRA